MYLEVRPLEIFNLEEGDGCLLPSKWLSLGGLGPDTIASEDIRPTSIVPLEGFRIWLRYSDGVEGKIDLARLSGSGVFSAWDDRGNIRVREGGLTWRGRLGYRHRTLW